jgi:LEA14-like dessication related protein
VIFNLSEGFHANPKDINLTIKKLRLEMSLYITSLCDLKCIEIEIQHPTWLFSKSSLKHIKEKVAKDMQYVIPIVFELKVKNGNHFGYNYSNLPTIRILSTPENSC